MYYKIFCRISNKINKHWHMHDDELLVALDSDVTIHEFINTLKNAIRLEHLDNKNIRIVGYKEYSYPHIDVVSIMQYFME